MQKTFASIVILTGAGISAESGIKTFRDANGLWENHRIEEVATPSAFLSNPELVHAFYNQRRAQLKDPAVQPNAAHRALAELERQWNGDFLLVTQNVDNLHERAGSQNLVHMHGQLNQVFCQVCEQRTRWEEPLSLQHTCPHCGSRGALRPDIVWFEEVPYHMERILEAVQSCTLFIAVGTSGRVYPAAGLARAAWKAHRFEINTQASDVAYHFHEHRFGTAGEEVPKLVAELLA